MRKLKVVCYLAVLGLIQVPLWAQQAEQDFASMSLEQLMQVPIEIATGSAKPISEAPAVVTVITADDIEYMGATNLSEVLETVPGFHVPTNSDFGQREAYAVRGLRTVFNVHVLVMLNGIPLKDMQNSGPPLLFYFPVSAIERVEVIRGPGSAIYGADAFAGLVNIITKDAKDINGTEIGARGGSFGFQNAWLQYGGAAGEWDVSLSLEWQQSDGDDGRIIASDQQGLFDWIFGTGASLAPGPLDTRYDVTNAHLELARGNWSFRLWGNDSKDQGMLMGVGSAIDPEGYSDDRSILGHLTYSNNELSENWELTANLSYMHYKGDAYFKIFPPGVVLPIGPRGDIDFSSLAVHPPTFFIDGYIGNPGTTGKTLSFDGSGLYTGIDRHRFRVGIGYSDQEIDTRGRGNHGPGVLDEVTLGGPPPAVVDGTMTDITGTPFIFMPASQRDLWYVSLQDEWKVAENWEATIGVRYDEYSDFGGTVNPRLALVWSGASNLIAKVLYASAYRAPSFGELTKQNNPVQLGNPNLDPEEIDTLELVFDYQPSRRFRAVLNLFSLDISELIELAPDAQDPTALRYQNSGTRESEGFELEAYWDVTDKFRLRGWYSWQQTEDKQTGLDVPWVPQDQFFLSANWRLYESWFINAQAKWIGEIEHPDDRPPVESYTRVDLTFGAKELGDRWDLTIAVRNLFDDEDARDAAASPFIMGDLPIEGRRYLAEVSFKF
jgi:iron complex outermembrane receptor protein